MAKFYVTTPIYYVNDRPHIGHTYTTIAADVLARYWRGRGEQVLFSVGLDENAQKTVNAAATQNQDIKTYTETMAKVWQSTWDKLGITYDRFVRTTSTAHQQAVYAFFEPVQARGDIYRGTYEGLYCVGHEAFLKPEDLVDGKCPEHGKPPEPFKEENYFFKLSAYAKPLLEHIKANPEFVQPKTRRNEVVAFITRGLEDISISRATQKWGIPFPGDSNQVVYVWFDALINYLTATGYPAADFAKWWPADVHLVGKDIIKFHCIIWPAMLLSAGLELPKSIFAHGFFTVEGQKVSKSLGNAIDPLAIAAEFGNDTLRYYLLKEIPFGGDGEFNHQRLAAVYTSDLANDLGNLVQRTAKMVKQYQQGVVGTLGQGAHDVAAYHEAVAKLELDKALAEVWSMVHGLNQYVDEEKPWLLAKQNDDEHLGEVLDYLVGNILQVGKLLEPFLPETAAKIAQTFADGTVHTEVGILFPKKERTKAES
ncbi:methionine--tRNA ligase [Candidatus Microgenomates bacterium]|nr:methionine--tRNA ligase [Candidatus Microgenomates bacterium]